jgi:hypothetical protein
MVLGGFVSTAVTSPSRPEAGEYAPYYDKYIDTERIFAYRALRISRNDQTNIEGFEQDDYVRYGPFARRPLEDLVEDYIAVRRATMSLFRILDEAAWDPPRRG